MGAETAISWCDSTFNGVRGCTKVSSGCAGCYAERDSSRYPNMMGEWGPLGKRRVAKQPYWNNLLKWDENAAQDGVRRTVFCYSYADVFEQHTRNLFWAKAKKSDPDVVVTQGELLGFGGDEPAVMDHTRLKLFDMIRKTTNLTYLLLTKRPESVLATLRRCADLCEGKPSSQVWGVLNWIVGWINGNPPENVRLGTSVEDQETANARIPYLLKIPNVLPWVSYEPALGAVDFSRWMPSKDRCRYFDGVKSLPIDGKDYPRIPELGWIVQGGESGPHARPFDLAWARATRDQCRVAGVPFFLKQFGARPIISGRPIPLTAPGPHAVYGRDIRPINLKHRSGADPSEWPADLRECQEFPK